MKKIREYWFFNDKFTLLIIFLSILNIYFLFTNRIYVVYLFYSAALFYLSMFPLSYFLYSKKDKFKCIMCGKCCNLNFKLKKYDIKELERGKINWVKFTDENWKFKKNNGYCIFLKEKNGKKICSIHKFKPYVCREWPFFNSRFSISWRWFTTCPSLRKLIKIK